MKTTNKAAAPTGAEAATTHKEDSTSAASSVDRLTDWRLAVVKWYSGGPRPHFTLMRMAFQAGLTDQVPAKPKDRVKVLALAGFDVEEIMAAVPELHPIQVAEIVDRMPGESFTVLENHLAGYTPLEIVEITGLTRSRIYYWLKKLGHEPNRRSNPELTVKQRDQVLKAYLNGEPMISISRRWKISYDQVRYAVKRSL